MTTVHHDRQVNALGEVLINRFPQPIVRYWVLPIQVRRAQDFVAAIRFITIGVRDICTVSRVMQIKHVARFGAFEQTNDARFDLCLRRLRVEKFLDLGGGEFVMLG